MSVGPKFPMVLFAQSYDLGAQNKGVASKEATKAYGRSGKSVFPMGAGSQRLDCGGCSEGDLSDEYNVE